jgi:hypothetical protein
MPDADHFLLTLGDAGLDTADYDRVDALCRSRLQAEMERERRSARRTPRSLLVATLVALAAFGTYAVPATRAAVDDVYSTVSDWVGGDDAAAPGRAIGRGEEVPAWVAAENGAKRVVAEVAGQRLFAIRQGEKVTFATANFGSTGTIDEYRKTLDGAKIVELASGDYLSNGRHDRIPLFGLVDDAVKRIRLNYADAGRPVTVDAVGDAWALVADANRPLRSLTGYDADGRLIATKDMTLVQLRYCPKAEGCTK